MSYILAVCLTTADKVSENDCIVYKLYLESKECAIVAYADVMGVTIAKSLE